MANYYTEDFLMHHGVLGMKWGVRHQKRGYEKRVTTDLEAEKGSYDALSDLTAHYNKTKTLSNTRFKKAINFINKHGSDSVKEETYLRSRGKYDPGDFIKQSVAEDQKKAKNKLSSSMKNVNPKNTSDFSRTLSVIGNSTMDLYPFGNDSGNKVINNSVSYANSVLKNKKKDGRTYAKEFSSSMDGIICDNSGQTIYDTQSNTILGYQNSALRGKKFSKGNTKDLDKKYNNHGNIEYYSWGESLTGEYDL